MAVTKTITKCTPYVNSSSKVDKWDIEMQYENDSEGDSSYYTSTFRTTVPQLDDDGNANFTLKAKSSWTNANLVAICPVSEWDVVFASQVDSVVTNPTVKSTPDNDFNVPS
jgi:hypothetical protein|tara:strand:+ start:1396 stop:1728 length:333 start_codon:yes stop_codon:yes gene_type:complete